MPSVFFPLSRKKDPPLELLLICALLGIFAGLVAGMLGVGGGLIIVPVLALLFAGAKFPEARIMQLAVGTSLATIVFTSISSVRAHHRHGAVLWPVFWRLTPGIVIGAWLGAAIADALPSDRLRLFFGWFELYVAVQMALDIRPRPHRRLPGREGMTLAGGIIGLVSAIVGIGGGTLTVPFLVWSNVDMRKAVATSAACGLPIALAGSIGFLVAGWGETDLPAGSFGYVYLPALAAIVVTSVLFAPLGARLAHRLPVKTLKRIFALLLFALAGKMLLR